MICPHCGKHITKGEVITILDSNLIKSTLARKAKPLNYHKDCWIKGLTRTRQAKYPRSDIPKLQSIIIGEDIFASVK